MHSQPHILHSQPHVTKTNKEAGRQTCRGPMGSGRTPEIRKLGACSSTSKRLRECTIEELKALLFPTPATMALTLPLTANHLTVRVYSMANHMVVRINYSEPPRGQGPPSVNHPGPWLRRYYCFRTRPPNLGLNWLVSTDGHPFSGYERSPLRPIDVVTGNLAHLIQQPSTPLGSSLCMIQ